MKKKTISLKSLALKKETIASLEARHITGGGPVTSDCATVVGPSCYQTCQHTCTLDGTIASKNVSNCCVSGTSGISG